MLYATNKLIFLILKKKKLSFTIEVKCCMFLHNCSARKKYTGYLDRKEYKYTEKF